MKNKKDKFDVIDYDLNQIKNANDYSKKENQIGCGYCIHEKDCTIRDPKINKAKQGCKDWKHWQDSNDTFV